MAEALALGVFCNGLVCLAVWLAMGGRSVADKVLAIIFPIAAFVTMGFEHSIANLFFLPSPSPGRLSGRPTPSWQHAEPACRDGREHPRGHRPGGGVYWLASTTVL